jgi:thiol-disulfide isomerase/thioredoxin
MKKILFKCWLLTYALLPLRLYAQEKGIYFEKGHTWDQIRADAKKENKYIFVDCYATWCGPCKQMDAEVYPDEQIGTEFNSQYIAIKLQMDSTKHDIAEIRNWYIIANRFSKQYKINALPTFLIFNPDGKLVHRGVGFKGIRALTTLLEDAFDTNKQYYTLLDIYKSGHKEYNKMPQLARLAYSFGDLETAKNISDDYINHYLFNDADNKRFLPENIQFINDFTAPFGSNSAGFRFFLANGARIDTIMKNKFYSEVLLYNIIEKEEINNQIYKGGNPFEEKMNPNWRNILKTIRKKYRKRYAEPVVVWAEIRWAENKRNWPLYCKLVIEKTEKWGPYFKFLPYADKTFSYDYKLNAVAWELFQYGIDKYVLNKALAWSNNAIALTGQKPNAEYMDTHANILYKQGQKQDAISEEERALAIAPDAKDIKENLRKMKNGEPTWPIRN